MKPSEILTREEPKFTPGPWDYGITCTDNLIDGACVSALVDGDDVHICELSDPGSFTQMEANVHLIAAAPDLYEALKRINDALYVDENTGEWRLPESFDTGFIDAALAKATGEAKAQAESQQ